MEINRIWCMPNKNTFDIKPVNELINKSIKNCTSDFSLLKFSVENAYTVKTKIIMHNSKVTQDNNNLLLLLIFGNFSIY